MSRDQRVQDNWALLFAQELALKAAKPLIVFFFLDYSFLEALPKHYCFMLEGLKQVQKNLAAKNISFHIVENPLHQVKTFLNHYNITALVTDFDPLKPKRNWLQQVSSAVKTPVFEVDAHNLVPCWLASGKQEYAAYTLRPKLNRLKDRYLNKFPPLKKQPSLFPDSYHDPGWDSIYKKLKITKNMLDKFRVSPGERKAFKTLEYFLENKLEDYSQNRNDPSLDATSDLSPYLHFGQISAQRIVQETLKFKPGISRDSFLEELIVRRELADNFCYYNPNYNRFKGFPKWSQQTLLEHQKDHRSYIYSLKQLEEAQTHDIIWNAAQTEMLLTGRMHGYLRMYWAKQILQWTPDPALALEYALYLNNHYMLDGRDPNGYTGVAWSIGGVHDRAWNQREVLGKIRYMSAGGLKRKFDIEAYLKKIQNLT